MGRSRIAGQDPHRHAMREAGSGKFTKKPPADGDPSSPPAAGGPITDPTTRPARKQRSAPPPPPPDPDRAGSGTGDAGGTGSSGVSSLGSRLWRDGLGALRRG